MTITDIADKRTEHQPAITVYGKSSCVQCTATTRKLDELGQPYTYVDFTEDMDAYRYILDLGFLMAPVVVPSEGEPWAGFDPARIERLAGDAA